MRQLMISACLAGELVRYNGKRLESVDPRVDAWVREGRAVLFCPEVEGGLPIPRDPAEISGHGGGDAVLAGTAKVTAENGEELTRVFVSGAEKALALCLETGVRLALLKEGSPSCGCHRIYDGHFTATRIPGRGVTSALLARHGIELFSEEEIDSLAARLR